jgi:hypothetical protein
MRRADFEIYGWPSDVYDPLAAYCEFTGEPTLTTDARSATYQLGANGTIAVQMGDLFDETGIYGSDLDAVPPGEYAFRTWAMGDGTSLTSGSLVIPPVGAGYLHASLTSALTNTLDNYSSGIIPGVVACVTPAKKSTWGTLKSLYR